MKPLPSSPSCSKYAVIPANSVFRSLLGEACGVWEDLSEDTPTSAEAENYHITLDYITAEGIAALKETLTTLSETGWVSATSFHSGSFIRDGKVCSLDAAISEKSSGVSVRFDLWAYVAE